MKNVSQLFHLNVEKIQKIQLSFKLLKKYLLPQGLKIVGRMILHYEAYNTGVWIRYSNVSHFYCVTCQCDKQIQ